MTELNPALIYTHKVETPELTGEIRLRKPTIAERYAYSERVGYEVGEDGKVEADKSGALLRLSRMIEVSIPHYLSVDLTKADGSKIDSVEVLMVEDDCQRVVSELASMIFGGFKPGKN